MFDESYVKESAESAHIYINEEKLGEYTERLNERMKRIEKVLDIEPKTNKTTINPSDRSTVLREDVKETGLTHEEAMKNAPDEYEGAFRVPKII
ncbi:MAG: Asp-tRNA(Asn)/Glu-tRNA(Gln) amidotransferase subunit GatC [Methanosarcinaceae archaeon]|nr:Asp-tRNA(Asn)/Glu-tRNA(Gln) amidotransferase subunit GatC [Methanosarcinaceae archaeon]